MKRAVLVLGLLLGVVAPAWAQSDLTQWSLNCPSSSTVCFRAHANSSAVGNFTITGGNIIAAGGYKGAFHFSHGDFVSITNTVPQFVPVAGNSVQGRPTGGVAHILPGYAGSIIGVSIYSSATLTGVSAAHAEAVITNAHGSALVATGLRAVIGATLTNTAAGAATQGRGISNFTASQGVGCYITSSANFAPLTAYLSCVVIVEF